MYGLEHLGLLAGREPVKPLSEMSLGHRAMITVAVLVVILILMALYGYFSGSWDEPPT